MSIHILTFSFKREYAVIKKMIPIVARKINLGITTFKGTPID